MKYKFENLDVSKGVGFSEGKQMLEVILIFNQAGCSNDDLYTLRLLNNGKIIASTSVPAVYYV